MNLLCELGWHSPGGLPRWNDGFYFTNCRRCGCDLVRTAYQKWHVPEGYRVVWTAKPPSGHEEIDLIPTPSAEPESILHETATEPDASSNQETGPQPSQLPVVDSQSAEPESSPAAGEIDTIPDPSPEAPRPAPPSFEEPRPARELAPAQLPERRKGLPISEVLDRLKAEDLRQSRANSAAPAPLGWSEDFMRDDSEDDLVIAPTVGVPRLAVSGSHGADAQEPDSEPLFAVAWRRARAAAAIAKSRFRGIFEATPNPWHVIGIALAISALIAIAVSLLSPSPSSNMPGTATPAMPQAALPEIFTPVAGDDPAQPIKLTQAGIVTASVLSCRSQPSLTAPRLRNLLAGQKVEIVARAGEWVAMVHSNDRCWAQARFVSAQTRR